MKSIAWNFYFHHYEKIFWWEVSIRSIGHNTPRKPSPTLVSPLQLLLMHNLEFQCGITFDDMKNKTLWSISHFQNFFFNWNNEVILAVSKLNTLMNSKRWKEKPQGFLESLKPNTKIKYENATYLFLSFKHNFHIKFFSLSFFLWWLHIKITELLLWSFGPTSAKNIYIIKYIKETLAQHF